MSAAPIRRTVKILAVTVIFLFVAAVGMGAIGTYASQRAHSPAVESYCASGALVYFDTRTGRKSCPTGDLRSKPAQGLDGLLGYNSRWYWFYAAGAAFVGMLVVMFLIVMHPARRRSSSTTDQQP